VHHNGRALGVASPRVSQHRHQEGLLRAHPRQEVEHGHGGVRDSVVRPRRVLEVADLAALVRLEVGQGEGGDGVVGAVLDGGGRHLEVGEGQRVVLVRGPVLAALGPAPLDDPRRHHDHQDLLLPDHAPEVARRLRQRALRRDERVLLLVAVHEVGVDVVAARVAVYLRQQNSTVVEAQHVCVPVLC